jgi:hypothetical protein
MHAISDGTVVTGGIGMNDLLTETIVYLGPATRLFPRDARGRAPSTTTLWRWRTRGVRGVRLESARLGGRVVTSLEAVRRFVSSVTETARPPGTPATPTPNRAAEQAQATATLNELWRGATNE